MRPFKGQSCLSFKLFPYATTSRWKPWKDRVFDCSTLKGKQAAGLALPGSKNYVSFATSLPAFPEHVEDDGPAFFFEEAMACYESRIEEFSKLCGLKDSASSLSRPVLLDRIGDQLTEILTPPSTAKRYGDPEIWRSPAWNSIRIDLGLFIGEQLIQEFPEANPKWTAPTPRQESRGPWDYPALRMTEFRRTASDSTFDPLEQRLSSLVLDAYGNRQDDDFMSGAWTEICERIFEQHGFDHDTYDLKDFSPTQLRLAAALPEDQIITHVFHQAEDYLSIQWLKRFSPENLDPYYSNTFLSLGDCLRLND